MADVVDVATRSRMMAGIRAKNTRPELTIRRGLHARGFRYRLHDKRLPGKPDLVFPRRQAVVFVHGCFWHGHDCHLFKWPKSRVEFWYNKINRNREKDSDALEALKVGGWRVLVIWECALKGRKKKAPEAYLSEIARWLESDESWGEIKGERDGTG